MERSMIASLGVFGRSAAALVGVCGVVLVSVALVMVLTVWKTEINNFQLILTKYHLFHIFHQQKVVKETGSLDSKVDLNVFVWILVGTRCP